VSQLDHAGRSDLSRDGVRRRDDHGAGVDFGRSWHFGLEPESMFEVRAGAGVGVNIEVCAGANQNF